MHLGTQVAQQKDVLALALHPAFEHCRICINDEEVEGISVPAGLDYGSLDQRFRLTFHAASHAAEHLIRNRTTIRRRVSGSFFEGPRLQCISELH
jgi:hypothetical protein